MAALMAMSAAGAQSSLELQNRAIATQQQASAERMRASLDRQAAAVRKQIKLAPAVAGTFFVISPLEPAPSAKFDCDAMSPMRAAALIDGASRRTGVSADLLNAVVRQESAFYPCAVSSKGARGLMQLMPATMDQFGVTDPFDPEQNVFAGAGFLKQLMERYSGDLNRVLGAYNAGPARVDAAGGVPYIPETMNYVEKILGSLSPALTGPVR